MPLPVNTTTMLHWAFLTPLIEDIDPAATFLQDLLFPVRRTVPTEVIELSYIEGGRKLAPFVTINGEAKTLPGRDHRFANVMAPNVNVKRPMEAYQSLLRRYPGTGVMVQDEAIREAYAQAIFDDTQILSDAITNRREWMAAQMATFAKIEYTPNDPDTEQDVFDITLPRDASFGGNTGVALTGNNRWRHTFTSYPGTEGTTSDPLRDFENAKFTMAKKGFIPTIAICGRRAAQGFKEHSKVREILKHFGNVNVGNITFQEQYTEAGALLLARDFAGIQVWEYSMTYEDEAGNEQYFLDPDAVLFISQRATRDNIMWFGAIPDHEAFESGQYMSEVFSKSWIQKTPSVRIQMAQTRPLPFARRPNGIYTLMPTPNGA